MKGHGEKGAVTQRGWRFVAIWSASILLLYFISGYAGARQLRQYKSMTEKTPLAASILPSGGPAQPGQKPVEVTIGIYINNIGEFAIKESSWAADFDIWFRWKGAWINPGESFRVVNGEVESREKMGAHIRDGTRYERYRVKARLTKFFDSGRFPFRDEALTIDIEDAVHGPEALRYVPDRAGSGLSAPGIPNFLKIKQSAIEIRPGLPDGGMEARPHLVYTMLVGLPSKAIYMRLCQALFASVAIAFIVFFIKPTFVDPRFGLGVGAVFAAVANNISVQEALPPPVQITLLQMVYAVSLITISLTLVQSAISLYILDSLGNERLYRFFDKASFAAFLIGYTAVNLALPIAASR